MDLVAGDLIAGDFRVVSPLRSGGMGAVYIVEQESVRRARALKVMHGEFVGDSDLVRRFVQEAQIAARIDSDHVVEVITAGFDEQRRLPYLVMELLEGENLAELIARHGRLGWSEANELFAQVCHALGAAHRAGIVHRDVKPENIFVARSRRTNAPFFVKILDFGIAKVIAEARVTSRSTGAVGSPLWMAPEQMERGDRIGPPADVWALGLVAYHALTGVYYWRCGAADANINALLKEVVLDPLAAASVRAAEQGVSNGLPPGFDDWFATCVDRDPGRRFANARSAHTALGRLFADAGVVARKLSIIASEPPPRGPPPGQDLQHTMPNVSLGGPAPAIARDHRRSNARYLWVLAPLLVVAIVIAVMRRRDENIPTATPGSGAPSSGSDASLDAGKHAACIDATDCFVRCNAESGAACFALAGMYDNGIGVSRDADLSLKFYKRACSLGHQPSCAIAAAAQPSVSASIKPPPLPPHDWCAEAMAATNCAIAKTTSAKCPTSDSRHHHVHEHLEALGCLP